MKLLCSSCAHQRSIINTTLTVPTWLCTLPWEQCTRSSCAFRDSPLSSSSPPAWLNINGKERKDDLYLLFTTNVTTCPFHENWGTQDVRQSDEGSLWAWRLALLSFDGACSRGQNQKVMQHVSSDRLPVRREKCYVSKHRKTSSERWAVLCSHVNHCLQLIWT